MNPRQAKADARANWVSAPVPYDWRQECWQILLATGADPDGDDPRHLNPGEALRAVEELREESDGTRGLEFRPFREADRG